MHRHEQLDRREEQDDERQHRRGEHRGPVATDLTRLLPQERTDHAGPHRRHRFQEELLERRREGPALVHVDAVAQQSAEQRGRFSLRVDECDHRAIHDLRGVPVRANGLRELVRSLPCDETRPRPLTLAQRGERLVEEDLAGAQDDDVVAERLSLRQVVRAQQRRAAFHRRAQVVVDLACRDRIEPDGRLVEEQHRGLREQRGGDDDAALEAARELRETLVAVFCQPERLDRGRRRRPVRTACARARGTRPW